MSLPAQVGLAASLTRQCLGVAVGAKASRPALGSAGGLEPSAVGGVSVGHYLHRGQLQGEAPQVGVSGLW